MRQAALFAVWLLDQSGSGRWGNIVLTFTRRVMTELRNELPDLNPRSILDFGSGPGTAALAVWDVWGREGGEMVDEDGNEIWEEGEAFFVSLT